MAAANSPFQRRYPPEMRERAVRMVREVIAESGERVGAVTRVARQLGIEKGWRKLNREGHKVGRDRVDGLMNDLGLSGGVRGKKKRNTWPADVSQRPADLVERNFTAAAPNRLWVADLTYVSTWSGFMY